MKMNLLHLRWPAYALAAALVVHALLSEPPTGAADVVQPAPRRVAAIAASQHNPAQHPTPGSAALALQTRTAALVLADPFAAPPSAPDRAQQQALALAQLPTQPASAATEPATAPPLPFSFLGRWTEQGRTTVFLRQGDKTVAVAADGRIDHHHQLRAVDEHGLFIEHLPSRSTQRLRFDASAPPLAATAATAAGKAGAAPAALRSGSEEHVGEN